MRRMARWGRAIACLLALASCGQPHIFAGTELASGEPAPALELIDQQGAPFSLGAQRGKVVVMSFGYTHCPDVCPATLGTFKLVRARLGLAAEGIRFVFITVDPERDTTATLRERLGRIDPAITGLTGPRAAIEAVARAYGVYHAPNQSGAPSGHDLVHTERIFVIDRRGSWRVLYPFTVDPSALVADLRVLLEE